MGCRAASGVRFEPMMLLHFRAACARSCIFAVQANQRSLFSGKDCGHPVHETLVPLEKAILTAFTRFGEPSAPKKLVTYFETASG